MPAKSKRILVECVVSTSEGEFLAAYSEKGLARLSFPRNGKSSRGTKHLPVFPPVQRWHNLTTQALHRALSGNAPGELPPLDISSGTAFQQGVWNTLRQIRPGETRSYGEIARHVGKPGAARAVGSACGANPILMFVPCHRVLAANHKIGGFSCGLEIKRRLLALEGIQPRG